MFDFKKNLNPAQLLAVTTTAGPVLVIAGAGSGKTRVIEYRVLNLIEQGVQPESILLLTFTRQAARQMLSRATKHNATCQKVDGGTFHSFAYKVLKKYAKRLGFADSFSILDESDAEDAIHKCCVELRGTGKDKRFPRRQTLKGIFSVAVNKGLKIADVLEKEYEHFLEYTDEIEKIRTRYLAYKIEKNYLDYDDLLIYLRLLLEDAEVRAKIAGRYRYVMVDEYQDTNRLQGDITYLLAKEHTNVMVVGDDAQSIYGFRGATHANIMEFPGKFSDTKIITLEDNYRSSQAILDVANAVLSDMQQKYDKRLVAARDYSGEKPGILFFKDTYEEAVWIADRIMESADEGVSLHEQAVLFRSSYVSIPLQAELSKRNIPYEVFGGLKFYETAHVKDLLSHLKIIQNPKDELSWLRVLELLGGIGPKTAEKITKEILAMGAPPAIAEGLPKLYDTRYKFSDALKKLSHLLSKVSDDAYDVAERFGYALDYYIPLMKEKFDDWPLRLNDLQTMIDIVAEYNSLDELLADFAIEAPQRGVAKLESTHAQDERPLTLSTIHSAKGLEWASVFLIGMADGILPSSLSFDAEEDLEEERRILYVALTRAKNYLFLSMHHEGYRGGITQFNRISRFIDTPAVLRSLNRKAVPFLSAADDVDEADGSEPVQLYDKDRLLRRIIDDLEGEYI
jgi:DNA helicase-2/ATP-dependent DNA helicase PcrA